MNVMPKIGQMAAWVVALAVAGGTSGCAAHSAQERYILVSANLTLPYWQQAAAGFQKAGAEEGVKALVMGPDTYNVEAEVKAFRAAAAEKPAGILVSAANADAMAPEIDAAIAAGIPVLTMDSDAPASRRVFFIGTNNLEAGRLGGKAVVKALGGHGNVVFFSMPGQANMDERLKGYMDVLSEKPGIRVVQTVDIRGDARVAFDRTVAFLTRAGDQKIDAFVCLEASSGKDVAEAVRRGNATGRTILAMDTDDDTLKLVQDGAIAATISQKPWTMAYVGLERLADIELMKNKHLGVNYSADPHSPYPALIDTGTALVNKGNVAEFMKTGQ